MKKKSINPSIEFISYNHEMTPADGEGVIQFENKHTFRNIPDRFQKEVRSINHWRSNFYKIKMIGSDPERYSGLGFGNISVRTGSLEFIVTGSQTGRKNTLESHDFAIVDKISLNHNSIQSRGQIKPSSESLTHGAIYSCSPEIRAIIHVHDPMIWNKRNQLDILVTDKGIGYGSLAMAKNVIDLIRKQKLNAGIIAMDGHLDGVISMAKTLDQAGRQLMDVYHLAKNTT